MSRLIDADELINKINAYCTGSQDVDFIRNLIKEQPTAYDTERVVEELEERSKKYNSGVRLHGKPEEMLTYEAIDIVRKEVQRMSRLIDAEDAINIITDRLFETLKTNLPCVTATENQMCLDTCYKVAKYEIDNIPTAYDVENVMAELKEAKFPITDLKQGVVINGVQQTDDAVLYDRAIDIVRKGVIK